jgi:trimethylamine--corrinoid protein Co-methyltransferase
LHAGKNQSGGFGLNLFSDDELHEIHLATLEVLQHTGIFVENEEALAIVEETEDQLGVGRHEPTF